MIERYRSSSIRSDTAHHSRWDDANIDDDDDDDDDDIDDDATLNSLVDREDTLAD